MSTDKSKVKKRKLENIPMGVVSIYTSFNNIIISITTLNGDVIASGSSGMYQFKGPKKGTPYASRCGCCCGQSKTTRNDQSKYKSKRAREWKRTCNTYACKLFYHCQITG
jgi:ribosomal protein S11